MTRLKMVEPAVPPHGVAAPDPQDSWVLRHQRPLWRFLRLLGCGGHLADDLAQDALLAALHKGIDARPDRDAAAWLREAARNLWRMHLRTQRRRPRHVELAAAETALLRHGEDGERGDAFVAALRVCVEQLDGRASAAIRLRYQDGASREAMATALAMTEDGVKTLLRRTREVLFACVQRRAVREDRS